jgi:MFS family permease
MGLVSSFQSAGQLIGPLVGGMLYGYGHDLPFMAMAAVILLYALLFAVFARPRLKTDGATHAGLANPVVLHQG